MNDKPKMHPVLNHYMDMGKGILKLFALMMLLLGCLTFIDMVLNSWNEDYKSWKWQKEYQHCRYMLGIEEPPPE